MRTAPTINTNRLTLRTFRPQDFEAYASLWQQDALLKAFDADNLSKGQTWESFLRHVGHWQMTGFGIWAVTRHREIGICGQVGFAYARKGISEDFDGWPEAHWVLHPDAQGSGLGLEAARAAHDWFDRVVTGPVVCKFGVDDAAAAAIAEHMGYALLEEREWRGRKMRMMLRKTPPQH